MKKQDNSALRAAVDGIAEINIQMRFVIETMKERAAQNRVKK